MVIIVYKFEECINSTILDASEVAKTITSSISKYFANEELIYNLRLIIAELMVNGVEHGNNCDCNKKVNLCVEVVKDRIIVRVKDQGSGINCNLDEYEFNVNKTCGRGLFIVQKLTDNLIIVNNEIVAEIYI